MVIWSFHLFEDDHHIVMVHHFLCPSLNCSFSLLFGIHTFLGLRSCFPTSSRSSPKIDTQYSVLLLARQAPWNIAFTLLSGTVRNLSQIVPLLETLLQWLHTRNENKRQSVCNMRSYPIPSHHSLPKSSVGLWHHFSHPSWLYLFCVSFTQRDPDLPPQLFTEIQTNSLPQDLWVWECCYSQYHHS